MGSHRADPTLAQLTDRAAEAARSVEEAIRRDGRYPLEAYAFLHEGLDYTTKRLFAAATPDAPRHVSGQELAEGLRCFALERWGMLAPAVFQRWSITRTRDFGEMVYFLIGLGLMSKQDSDRIEDFDDVYTFADAFGDYRIELDPEAPIND